MEIKYLSGFGNHFSSQSIADTLPQGQNSPQKVSHGLYTEQLSGTAFTALRHENHRSWLYRIRPSVMHGTFYKLKEKSLLQASPLTGIQNIPSPQQFRWDPLPVPKKSTDFLQGLITFAVNGDLSLQKGCAIHLYAINQSMEDRFFYNADGELLFVPLDGALHLRTEFGPIEIKPGEIAVIPRGIKFQVQLKQSKARGYVCENYGPMFRLPSLGPIGSNGLANSRDFLSPEACFEDKEGKFSLIVKYQGHLWEADINHSPLDVVGWHGNYVPYKYDLCLFQAVNSVSFDHCDPSIFTVLTSPSEYPGIANIDFVIFPPRWMVAEHTFRPPYFHRNIMSEYMGLIFGKYDAKEEGFEPGGGSLHNCMSAHGPDAATYKKAIKSKLNPVHVKNTLAFMFESRFTYQVTDWALETKLLQKKYSMCWQGLKKNFKSQSKKP